jgi:RNA polymerase sigma-70 factor (ECF subfamily)
MTYPSQWPAAETLARLISDAQSGSAASMDALLSALRPALVGFFAQRLSADAAEDLAQAALLRIVHALPSIEPERGDRFVVTIACNLVRTAYTQRARERRRWAPVELADRTVPSAADRHAEYQELADEVHRICAAELPPPLQEIMLGLLRGETPTEIAERLHLNPVTVRTRLMRARAILRRELRPYLELDGDRDDCSQLSA